MSSTAWAKQFTENGAAFRLLFILRESLQDGCAEDVLAHCDPYVACKLRRLYREGAHPAITSKRERVLLCHPDRWHSDGSRCLAKEALLRSEAARASRERADNRKQTERTLRAACEGAELFSSAIDHSEHCHVQ